MLLVGQRSFGGEESSGVELWVDEPVAVLAPNHAISTHGWGMAVADSWRVYHISPRMQPSASVGVIQPVPGVRPTCAASLRSESLAAVIGTSGAHLLGAFNRTEADWTEWERVHGQDADPWDLIGSYDRLDERAHWTQPWGAPPDLRSLAVLHDPDPNARNPDVSILANAHVGGVVRSDDLGATWRQLVDVHIDVHQVATDSPSTIVIASGTRGCGISHDKGDTWTFPTEGLHADYGRAVTITGGHVLLSTSSGPDGSDARLYRRPLDGATPFEPVADIPQFDENLDTHLLASRSATDVAAFAKPDGRVFASTDAGRTWALLGVVPGTPRAVMVSGNYPARRT